MSPRQRRATQNFSLSQSTDSSVQQHGSQTANRASQSTNCYFDSFSHHQHQTQIVMNFSGNTQYSSLAMAIGYPLVQGVERCGLKNGWETGKQPISPACLRNGAKPLVTSRSPTDSSSQQPRTTPTGGFQPKTECVNGIYDGRPMKVGKAITKCRQLPSHDYGHNLQG